jgi:hypothetical protein
MIRTVLEATYLLLFVVLPVLCLAYLWRRKKIATFRGLLLILGLLIAVGFASWRILFGTYFIASTEIFFLLNLPMGALVSYFSSRLSPFYGTLMDILVPLAFYPCLGYLLGCLIDRHLIDRRLRLRQAK